MPLWRLHGVRMRFGSDDHGGDQRRRETCNVDRHSRGREGEVNCPRLSPERFSRTPRARGERGRILLRWRAISDVLIRYFGTYMPKPTMALLDIEKSVAGFHSRQRAISRMSWCAFCQRIRRLRREEGYLPARTAALIVSRKLGFLAMKSDVSRRRFRHCFCAGGTVHAAATPTRIAGREVCIVISLCICRRFVCSFARLLVFSF